MGSWNSRLVHGFRLEEHDSVSSTQQLLRQLVTAGVASDGYVVRAREQLAGKGRRGTAWHSSRGGSYQSVALEAGRLVAQAAGRAVAAPLPDPRLTLAIGLGIAESLNTAGAAVMLKWPNDLIANDAKLGGIIVELVAGVALVGVGVNVDNELPHGAAGLRGWSVDEVGDLVLAGVRNGLWLLTERTRDLVPRYSSLDWLRGRTVTISAATLADPRAAPWPLHNAAEVRGVADGIDDRGRLLVVDPSGERLGVVSGHVNLT